MSEGKWAAIVYGRSYHLDFRFITVPDNFTAQDIQWASTYIVATTQQARNLAGSPRWSLFKNDSHCVVGVTCMVRDLVKQSLDSNSVNFMTKDDQGRPLYVFVGYVTELNQQGQLDDFPAYQAANLEDFRLLYQEIEQVWLVKNYERQSTPARLSSYQPISFSQNAIAPKSHQIPTLNELANYPQKTFVWPNLKQQNRWLWLASAKHSQATSICLNIEGKTLVNSPFLNQSCSQIEQFQIQQRIATVSKNSLTSSAGEHEAVPSSLSQKISQRAIEDLDLTLQQAAKVATASQELIHSFADWSNQVEIDSSPSRSTIDEIESFGFKTKKSDSDNQDWF
ncbi:MAG: hypothetical protein AAFY16_04885 [Cyanobacteria bacterium J06642_3]